VVTSLKRQLSPVKGFWSLTLNNGHRLFHLNALNEWQIRLPE
jgi:hypothetical protein